MPEQTLTLRQAARRLARIWNPRGKKIESSRLLDVLRSGELKAGFYILSGTTWIEIPLSYWQEIDGNRFRRIGRNSDDPKSGTYHVKPNEFPDQVTNTLCSNEQDGLSREMIAAVINETSKRYEVTIKADDFVQYLQCHKLEEEKRTTTGGRRRKEGWRELCSYMAAYFAAHQRDRGDEPLKIDHAKDEIIAIAKAKVSDLPAADTIKHQISKAKDLLESPEFKLK